MENEGRTSILDFRGHTDLISFCAWSPDGQYILSASDDGTLVIWDASNGAEMRRIIQGETVSSCVWSPDGKRILSAPYDGKLKVWNASTGMLIASLIGRTASVESCILSL